jgi:hypothetical protein
LHCPKRYLRQGERADSRFRSETESYHPYLPRHEADANFLVFRDLILVIPMLLVHGLMSNDHLSLDFKHNINLYLMPRILVVHVPFVWQMLQCHPSTLPEVDMYKQIRVKHVSMQLFWLPVVIGMILSGCGGSSSDSSSSSSNSSSSSSSSTSSSASSTSSDSSSSTSSDCTSGTYVANVVCAANAFIGTLTTTQLASAYFGSSSNTQAQLNVYKTMWSNLPATNLRVGIPLGSLTTSAQVSAYYALADAALTDAGYADFLGVEAADDYLGTLRSGYSSDNYPLAIVGTPSTTGQWTLMLGGHHMAYIINFADGAVYPTPHHIGIEPKASFTVNNSTYQVLANKAAAMLAVFYGQTDSLTSTQRSSAYLTGQTFSDILIGPVEHGTGSYSTVAAAYPTSNRGLLVSTLTSAQKALITAAISTYVSDYDSSVSEDLLSAYTSDTAYASTYVAWGGNSSLTYPNIDTDKTYLRIDGPRVWIEIACQAGVVISSQTHYHMMFRDKAFDYYDELSN